MENLVKKLGADGVEAKRQVKTGKPAELLYVRVRCTDGDRVDGGCRTLTLPCAFTFILFSSGHFPACLRSCLISQEFCGFGFWSKLFCNYTRLVGDKQLENRLGWWPQWQKGIVALECWSCVLETRNPVSNVLIRSTTATFCHFVGQVLYQTVSDPQQRIAKLTAKDPRRRRMSSGGSSVALGGPRQDLGLGPGPRRTSFPGTASFTGPATPQRFGWNPATPTRHIGDKPRSNSDRAIDGAKAWGSPIVKADDLSMEGAAAGSGVGVGTGTPDNLMKPGVGVGSGGADASVTGAVLGTEHSQMGERAYQPGDIREGSMGYDSDPKLYSDTSQSEDDEEDGGGGAEGGVSRHGEYGDGGYRDGGGDSSRYGFGDDVGDDAGDDLGEDVKEYVEEDDVADYVDGAAHVQAGGAPAEATTHDEGQGGHRLGAAHQRRAGQVDEEAEQARNAGMSITTGARREEDDDDAHTASTGEEHCHSWPPSPEGGTAPNWAGTSSSETSRSPGSERELARTSEGRAESSTSGGVGDAPAAVGVSNSLGSLPADASEPSDTASTASGGGAWQEASDPLLPTSRGGDARGSSAPSKRITWAEDQGPAQEENEAREGEGDAEWGAHAEESDGRAGHRSAGVGVGAGHGDHPRTAGHTSVRSRRDEQREPLDRGGSRRPEAVINSSAESGGGAGGLEATLAASGVFDTTGTSGGTEENGDGASDGDADSLESTGAQGGAWTSQRQEIERRREREGRQNLASDDGSDDARGGGRTNDDVSLIIEDLMRQVCAVIILYRMVEVSSCLQ